jgi:hypothetical protein
MIDDAFNVEEGTALLHAIFPNYRFDCCPQLLGESYLHHLLAIKQLVVNRKIIGNGRPN